MTREYRFFIQDILKALVDIDKFVAGMDFNNFLSDEKTKSAVVWQIQIIGEATKNIPKSIREKYKEIPWKYMARMRDKIAHFYFGVDYDIVWEVIQKRLPEIKPYIEQMLVQEKEHS
ncbi:DUF86 domain-containing protein [bacterium]|nr:DUF86 domain-containing protein [bacterium]